MYVSFYTVGIAWDTLEISKNKILFQTVFANYILVKFNIDQFNYFTVLTTLANVYWRGYSFLQENFPEFNISYNVVPSGYWFV